MNKKLVLPVLVATLGGFLFGYDTGVINGALVYFVDFFNFTESQEGWAVSSALLGCILGGLTAGMLGDGLGRKKALLLAAFLFLLSAIGSATAWSLSSLVIFRIVGGVGIGIASMLSPMYISEVSPPEKRGAMVSLNQMAIVSGFLIVFFANFWIGNNLSEILGTNGKAEWNLSSGWRWMFGFEIIPAGLFMLLLFFVPESPRYFMLKGMPAQAQDALVRLGNSPEKAQASVDQIQHALDTEVKASWGALKGLGFAVFVGIMLSIFQQLTGINAILYYGSKIFASLGGSIENALFQNILLAVVNFGFTILAIIYVDKWGRKPFLIFGGFWMAGSLALLTWAISSGTFGVPALIGILSFIAGFAMTWGPVTWVLLSEIFPDNARAIAMAIAVAVQWTFNWAVSYTFPVLMKEDSVYYEMSNGTFPYWVYMFSCVAMALFVWKFVPETKGRDLKDMREMWTK